MLFIIQPPLRLFAFFSVLTTTTSRVANSLVLLSRAKLGDVNGGGGTGGISCFCCVDGCASRPACPPKRVCPACFSLLFSLPPLPPSSLPIAHPPCARILPSRTCRMVTLHEGVLPIPFCTTHCFLSLVPSVLCLILPPPLVLGCPLLFSDVTCRPPALLSPLSSLLRVPPVRKSLGVHTPCPTLY